MKNVYKDNKCISEKYINREYSWLLFNKRVLEQAKDLTNPLLERAKFLSIFSSNLDEFISVRYGSLYNQNIKNPEKRENKTNLTALEQMEVINSSLPLLYKEARETYSFIKTELESLSIKILNFDRLKINQLEKAKGYFENILLPMVSATVLGEKHPLIRFSNLKTYLVAELEKEGLTYFGIASIDSSKNELIKLTQGRNLNLITTDELLLGFANEIFTSYNIVSSSLVRITRNADLSLKIDKNKSFADTIEREIYQRETGKALRLEIDKRNENIENFLKSVLEIETSNIFEIMAPFAYNFLNTIDIFLNQDIINALKYKPFKQTIPNDIDIKESIIKQIEEKDRLLFYPYHSMETFLKILDEAAEDESVKSISITIYRLSRNSRILKSLLKALSFGKTVRAVLELSARFDEKRNIISAKELQEKGAIVIYGMKDLKIHTKLLSIVKENNGEISYITHIGTGNYNESTSSIYTDLNLLTSDKEIGRDANAFFRNLSIQEMNQTYKKLIVAPLYLKDHFIKEIEEETMKGKDGLIECKMNSLTDKDMIDKLSKAANEGVRIRLLVRGLCSLKPQSDNITITSIVSRFLEHSRIYKFGKDNSRVYIASSDFMTRNLERRFEIAIKIEDEDIKKRVESILSTHLNDNVKAKRLDENVYYKRVESISAPLDSQDFFLENSTKI